MTEQRKAELLKACASVDVKGTEAQSIFNAAWYYLKNYYGMAEALSIASAEEEIELFQFMADDAKKIYSMVKNGNTADTRLAQDVAIALVNYLTRLTEDRRG